VVEILQRPLHVAQDRQDLGAKLPNAAVGVFAAIINLPVGVPNPGVNLSDSRIELGGPDLDVGHALVVS
jgi:hypothetical protein